MALCMQIRWLMVDSDDCINPWDFSTMDVYFGPAVFEKALLTPYCDKILSAASAPAPELGLEAYLGLGMAPWGCAWPPCPSAPRPSRPSSP